MTNDDPLGLSGRMIGQFRVGRLARPTASALLYTGWDLARQGSSGSPSSVWLQFFDGKRSQMADAIQRQATAWSTFEHPAFASILGYEAPPDHLALVAMLPGEGIPLHDQLETLAGDAPPT